MRPRRPADSGRLPDGRGAGDAPPRPVVPGVPVARSGAAGR